MIWCSMRVPPIECIQLTLFFERDETFAIIIRLSVNWVYVHCVQKK